MFGTDERGQAIQVGAVILFSFVVIAFSLYQASVVPSQNTAIEVQHNERVQSDMLDVRNAVLSSVSSGANPFVEVGLGTQYPARALAINPAPPSGLVRTTDSSPVTVLEGGPGGTNVSNDVCPGTSAPRSRLLTYQPTYNYLDAESIYVENTVAFTTTGDDPLVLSGQRFLVNNTVNLVPMRNEYQQQGTGSASVEPVPGGAVTTTVSDPVIEVPTELDTTTWQEILGDQLESGESASVSDGTLTLDLSGDYEIVCAPVGINGPPPSGARSSSLTPGTNDNSPEDGGINPSNPGDVRLTDIERAPGDTDVIVVTLRNPAENVTLENARFNFYQDPNGDGPAVMDVLRYDGGIGALEINDLELRGPADSPNSTITLPGNGTTTEIALRYEDGAGDTFNTQDSDFAVTNFDFSSGQQSNYFLDIPKQGDTVSNDPPTADFTFSPSTPESNTDVSFDASGSSDSDGSIASYEWDFDNGRTGTGETTTSRYNAEGSYDVTLTVTDDDGATDSVTRTVTVGTDGGGGGGGGGSGASSSIEYNNDSSPFFGGAGIQFSISNAGNSSVTIERISVNTNDTRAEILRETNGGGPAAGQNEIFISADTDGWYEAGDQGSAEYPLGTTVGLTQQATIAAGSDATFSVYEFRTGGSGNSGSSADVQGDTITITLYFSDGSSTTISFQNGSY